jgi:hypothetical protein
MAIAEPGSVSVIDFDGVDPDVPQQMVPSNLGRLSWEKLLSIALDDFSQRIAPTIVVVCEGSATGNRRKNFDAEIYNRILGSQFPDILFVSGGSSNELASSGISIRTALEGIIPAAKFWALADRDDKSDEEVAECGRRGVIILPERNLESFLFADDVIDNLLAREQKQELRSQALDIKQQAITESISRGNAPDDLKSAAGEIYNKLRLLLDLNRCGNNSDAFMRDTLAPLIKPPMSTYKALKEAVVDKLL